jgi:glycerophosphoryl diester phosphodiesterase
LNAPRWLVAKPIAHRGLHNSSMGIVENTLAAAQAAMARGYSIECDVQLSRDGEAIVFHDAALDRLTKSNGLLGAMSAREIAGVAFKRGDERIPTLGALLGRIAGRVPLICEIKSGFDGDIRLAERVAQLAGGYAGPLALKSFDPAVIAHLRACAPPPDPQASPCPLGIVAQASYEGDYWRALTAEQKKVCANFLHLEATRPDFLSWCVDDLPHPTPFLLQRLGALPVMAWTVRTKAEKQLAGEWADQMIFEGDLTG